MAFRLRAPYMALLCAYLVRAPLMALLCAYLVRAPLMGLIFAYSVRVPYMPLVCAYPVPVHGPRLCVCAYFVRAPCVARLTTRASARARIYNTRRSRSPTFCSRTTALCRTTSR